MPNRLYPNLAPWITRLLAIAAVVMTAFLMVPQFDRGDDNAQAAGSTGRGEAVPFHVAAGTIVEPTFSDTPPVPTAQELDVRNRALENADLVPRLAPQPKVSNPPVNSGLRAPQQEASSFAPDAALAPGALAVLRSTVLPRGTLPGANAFSYIMEPSTGVSGKNIFQVGNWYAARSFDNGATWSYMNPYKPLRDNVLTGFCCDQVTLYDPSRDAEFWVLQYNNGLKVALSHGGTILSSWCFYDITPATIGQSVTEMSYGDLAVGARYLYLTANVMTGGGGLGSMIVRMPMDALLACSGFSGSSFVRTESHTFKMVQGAADVMYWGTNWTDDLPLGSSMRLFAWPENSSSYWVYDRTGLPSWTFFTVNGGQNCGSLSGATVKNWCQETDSRVLGGALVKTQVGSGPSVPTPELYFSFNAMQDGTHPFPYTRIFRFSELDKSFTGEAEQWASWGAIEYTSLSPNSRSDLGMVFAFGGQAVGGPPYYPGSGIAVQDDYSPTPPWNQTFVQLGQGNTCLLDGLYVWGDYLTVRPYYPAGDLWVAGVFAAKNVACSAPGAMTEARNIVFGRGRDAASYYRWNTK